MWNVLQSSHSMLSQGSSHGNAASLVMRSMVARPNTA
jgi:hypothetical protein